MGSGGKFISNAVGDVIGGITGANRQAEAAQSAAQAQLAAAQANKWQIMDESDRMEREVMGYARPNELEQQTLAQSMGIFDTAMRGGITGMQALERQLMNSERQIANDERMLASIDPTILEASNQVLKLMRGEKAGALKPLEDQRTLQRQQLVDSLRQQFGQGAEGSSLGLKSLNDFDMQTASMMAGTQQQSLGGLLGVMQTGAGSRGAFNQGFGNFMSAQGGLAAQGQNLANLGSGKLGMSSVFQNRLLNTRQNLGTTRLNALAGANTPLIQSAGADFVGEQIKGQAQVGLWNSILSAGAAAGGAAAGKKLAGG